MNRRNARHEGYLGRGPVVVDVAFRVRIADISSAHAAQLLVVVEKPRLLGGCHVGRETMTELAEMSRDDGEGRVSFLQR